MIDIHCHILPEVDDGSRSLEESVELLKEAKQNGFTDIIVTPHYMEEYYEKDVEQIENTFNMLKQIIKQQNLRINIYQGNEIYVTREITDLLKQKKATSLNKTKYILFELPMHNEIIYLNEIIFSLLSEGYIPIIAHPERYAYVQKNPNCVVKWIENGVLLQSNYASILGYYGKEAKQTIIKLLDHNLVHFLGSDTHRKNSIYPNMNNILEEFYKHCDKKTIIKLTQENPSKLLKNEIIEIEEPQEISKKGFWEKFRFSKNK